MFQREKLSLKSKIYFVIVFIVFSGITTFCVAVKMNVMMGEKEIFNFEYPCDSTKVTLQHSYRRPFYNSNNPGSVPLPANYLLENQNDTVRNECSLHLTINPVSRDDEGTYILIPYKNGAMLSDFQRIGVHVDYPPGKASCESSNDYNDGEWVSLQCTAPVGSLPGQIICYQNDMRLSPGNKLTEIDGKLNQIILARLDNVVYCCSFVITGLEDKCNCTEWRWDPMSDSVSDVVDPCPQAMSTQDQTSTHSITIVNTNSSSSSLVTTQANYPENYKNKSNWKLICALGTVIFVLAISFVSILFMYCCKANELTNLQSSITAESTDPCLPDNGEQMLEHTV